MTPPYIFQAICALLGLISVGCTFLYIKHRYWGRIRDLKQKIERHKDQLRLSQSKIDELTEALQTLLQSPSSPLRQSPAGVDEANQLQSIDLIDLKNKILFDEAIKLSPIRALQIGQIFPGIESCKVEIGAVDPDTKHLNHVDMLYVCAIARYVEAKRIFEFGTYLGRTTLHLALGPAKPQVFSLDLAPGEDHAAELDLGRAVRSVLDKGLQGHFFTESPVSERVTQLQSDSRFFDFSPYRGSMDFIFIDGGHLYQFVESDTIHALEMLRPGGVIVWHDFAPKSPDVVKFARKFSETRPLFWLADTSLLIYRDGIDAMSFDVEVPVYARGRLKS